MDQHVINQAKLESFVMRAISDVTAGYMGVMVSLGSKLGLYKALAGAGPLSAKEVARRAGCAERYVREWLNAQAAGGYLFYHGTSDTYELLPEQAMVLADEDSPVFIPHAWNVPASMWFDEEKALNAFRTGKGIAWGEHDGRLACGVASFYRNGYRASLVSEWLPALDGVLRPYLIRMGADLPLMLILPGVIGAICLLLGLYALQVLSVNFAGLALVLLGLAMMIAEFFAFSHGVLGLGGLVAFVVGSVMLMDTHTPGFAVSHGLIGGIATFAGVAMLGTMWMAMRARRRPVVTGTEQLVGDLAGDRTLARTLKALDRGARRPRLRTPARRELHGSEHGARLRFLVPR